MKLSTNAQEVIMNIEKLLTDTYGNEVREHFPWSTNQVKQLPTAYSSIPNKSNNRNEDEDLALEDLMLKEENDTDTLAHIYLEGLDIINKKPIDQQIISHVQDHHLEEP